MSERIKFGSLESIVGKGDHGEGKETSGFGSKVEILPFSVETILSKEKHEEQMRKFQLEMRARTIAAPTHDNDVKLQLRKFEEPICLFGEGPAERRDRLKRILAKLEVEQGISAVELVKEATRSSRGDHMDDYRKEAFFTEGPEELKKARLFILHYSMPRAQARVGLAKRKQVELDRYIAVKQAKLDAATAAAAAAAAAAAGNAPAGAIGTAMAASGAAVVEGAEGIGPMEEDNEVEKEHMTFIDKAGAYRHMDLNCSQIGDVRPISACCFSPDGGKCLATASWSGQAKVWRVPSCDVVRTLVGHRERLSDVKFHPDFRSEDLEEEGMGGGTVALATGSADKTVRLWGSGGQTIRTLAGHADRLCRIAFHPSGRFLGTASFDRTWRLWDLEAGGREVLCQEGHSRAVYAIAFQGDGSLVASAGLDAIGRVWDLRTGRSIYTMQGHVKQVLGLDWCSSGVRLATGSGDNTVRLWDMRRRKCYYTIPAHSALISGVKFSACGDFLFTSSYDRTCKVWNLRNCTAVRTLAGHDEKVMSVDVSGDEGYLATSSYDRTFKLWVPGAWHD